jgi:hypothetical protein
MIPTDYTNITYNYYKWLHTKKKLKYFVLKYRWKSVINLINIEKNLLLEKEKNQKAYSKMHINFFIMNEIVV